MIQSADANDLAIAPRTVLMTGWYEVNRHPWARDGLVQRLADQRLIVGMHLLECGPADELGRRESGESLDRIGYESNRAVAIEQRDRIDAVVKERAAHPLALLHFALAFATHPHHLKASAARKPSTPLCISLQKIPSGSLREIPKGISGRVNVVMSSNATEDGTLLLGERHVLELIATGASLQTVLDALCRVIDERSGLISSISCSTPTAGSSDSPRALALPTPGAE